MMTAFEVNSLLDLLRIAHRAHGPSIEATKGAVQTNIGTLEIPSGILSIRETTARLRQDISG